MTTLVKPISRLVEFGGHQIIVTIVPEDAGIPPHIKFRTPGQHKSYGTVIINPPAEKAGEKVSK